MGLGLPGPRSRFWPGGLLLLVSLATLPVLLHELAPGRLGSPGGGWLGGSLAHNEQLLMGRWGALLMNGFLLCVGLLSLSGISTGVAIAALAAGAAATGELVGRGLAAFVRALTAAGAAIARGVTAFVLAVRDFVQHSLLRVRESFSEFRVWRERRARRARVAASRDPEIEREGPPPAEAEAAVAEVLAEEPAGLGPGPVAQPAARSRKGRPGVEPHIVDHSADREEQATPPSQEHFQFAERGPSGPFQLPDISIFHKPEEGTRTYDRDSLLMNSRILEKKLADFGVTGKVVRVHPGPVITMYEYEPASGVKVNKIVNLSDDLAMALRALSIRIIAPLPGKSVVGIEVPNTERETVYLRSLLETESFRRHPSKMCLAMGKDIFGNAVDADLAKMPHLLVAGATGTGKSVFLNSLLCSLLCRATPDDLKLLLIDPKLLELSIYEGIPHLIADVVTNPKRAAAALQGVVRKMEERYQIMSALQVRNISQYNDRAREEIEKGNNTFRLRPKPGETEGQEVEFVPLPYIVVVIDELADLMVTAAKDVEESLQRLAQMARAAGIHLVLATQRPSVDVLTGVIKANFPARVSFQVSSRTDSRTILDQNGADNLLGQGDMLFLPPGTSRLSRLHGPFVTEKEVGALVASLREQGAPIFDDTLVKLGEESDKKEARGEDVDEMFDQAVAMVAETRNASISYVFAHPTTTCRKLGAAFGLASVLVLAAATPVEAGGEEDAGDACAALPASRIKKRYEGIRDLEARFEQTTKSISLGSSPLADDAPSRGTVVFEKPGKMRWTYLEPIPSIVVSDGEVLWIVDPLAKEAQRLAVSQGYLSGAALVFLMGDGVLADEFQIALSADGNQDCEGEEPVELELRPIREATYERLGLSATPETGEIVATTIVDLFGNVTEVRFTGWQSNRDPEDKVFTYEPGDDIKVIDLGTPP
jgi:outer membrane lipoprotein-sorting protein